ncbi:MAG: SAM-dependent methyltransferase [Cellvibrionaceae bacterium]|jgi:SAM-dependent methyltransferase
MSTLNSLINRLIASNDSAETRAIYAEWAATYDGDLDNFGYVAPQLGTAMFGELLTEKSASVYDAGCGTGLAGQCLADMGYTQLHGADFSPDMLAKARLLNVYQTLMPADFCAPIALGTGLYDGIISIGVYSSRFKTHFLPEMIRILKPGAPMLFTCRPHYFEDDVKIQLDKMKADQTITDLAIIEKPYMQAQAANAYYISFRKK